MAAVLVWHGAPSRRYPRPETEPDPSPRAGPEAEPGPRMIQGPKKRARSVGPPDRAGPSDPPGLGRARVNLNARQTHPPAQDTPAGRGADLCPAGGEGGEAARVHSAQGRFPASAPSLPRPTPPETPAEFRLVITGAVAAPRPPRSAAIYESPAPARARPGRSRPAGRPELAARRFPRSAAICPANNPANNAVVRRKKSRTNRRTTESVSGSPAIFPTSSSVRTAHES